MMNYKTLLLDRAKHAQPRRSEHVPRYLLEANARALLAWRIKWHRFAYFPDAWPAGAREWFDYDLRRKRVKALAWFITYSPQDLGDLYRLTSELTSHLNELSLDEKQLKKAQAQIATIKAQLSDEPDPIILKQAGRTLRNVIEGAVGSLIATAASQPTIWSWVHEVMLRLMVNKSERVPMLQSAWRASNVLQFDRIISREK
jgi:hypothetical protein